MKRERTASKRRGRIDGHEQALAWQAVWFEVCVVLVVSVFESDGSSRARCPRDKPP